MEISNQTVYSYDTLMEYHRRHVKDLRVLSIVLLVISSVSLAVSMAEPPPIATIASAPHSLKAATPLCTFSMVGFGLILE